MTTSSLCLAQRPELCHTEPFSWPSFDEGRWKTEVSWDALQQPAQGQTGCEIFGSPFWTRDKQNGARDCAPHTLSRGDHFFFS